MKLGVKIRRKCKVKAELCPALQCFSARQVIPDNMLKGLQAACCNLTV